MIVHDLYDYPTLRQLEEATMFAVHPRRATLVLGGNQSVDVLDPTTAATTPIRRRRGGGGLVLVRPDDLWVDWWIPRDDDRWSHDVRESSLRVGEWWADALNPYVKDVRVHEGALEGEVAFRLVCFAGQGPGEVFVDGRKAVGVTQWRVREGVFLSTILHAEPTSDVLDYLRVVPDGLADALDHVALSSLSSLDPTQVLARLGTLSG
ncbi:MAG: hypothetical protein WCA31_09205, partial [Acidimicrobiales bacterium]